jgi:hypothetical protein
MPSPIRSLADLLRALDQVQSDPRAQAAIKVCEVLLPKTAERVREVRAELPSMLEELPARLRDSAARAVRHEADELDALLSRKLRGRKRRATPKP